MVSEKNQDTPSNMPGGSERVPLKTWLVEEIIDHLFPWSEGFWKKSTSVKAAGISLAVIVTTVWLLAAAGRIGSVVVLAWWIGWSVYEAMCRIRCKPWIKTGPWWGRQRRKASKPDIIFYVATKNLLVGILFFLMLVVIGVI